MRFEDFARAHGVVVRDLYASERIRRCATVEHERSKNGAYYWDGKRGWVMAWDGDGRVHWFNDESAQPWTEAEKLAWKQRNQSAAQERERRYAQAAKAAKTLIDACKCQEHGYLIRKGFRHEKGLVSPDGALVIPMRDLATAALHGAQVLTWDDESMAWVKKFIFGTRAKNAIFRLGNKHAPLTVLVEGYATGLSVAEALRQMRLTGSVLVCFSAGNLVHVAKSLPGRAIVFADHDLSMTGEQAAKQTGLPYCISPVPGEDANDLHQRAGLLAVCSLIQGAARYVAAGAT